MSASKDMIKIMQVRIGICNINEKRTADAFFEDRESLADMLNQLTREEQSVLKRTNTIVSFLDADWITFHDIYTGAEITIEREEEA